MEERIVVLKGPDRVRKRPAVILGSDSAAGCFQMVCGLIKDAVQEYQLGEASWIHITKLEAGSYIIEDDGSGIPV